MKNKKDFTIMLKEAGIMFGITLLAGIMLGFVYELTKEPIAYQQELKIQRTCAAVFAEASIFKEMELIEAVPDNNGFSNGQEPENQAVLGKVYRALSSEGVLLGYVINITSGEGYNGDIELMMGVTMEGKLNGISFLSISETPGLGMQAEEVLAPQFAGKTADAFTYTKTGAIAENQIDAISGATVTTKAVTDAVNKGLYYFNSVLKEGEPK